MQLDRSKILLLRIYDCQNGEMRFDLFDTHDTAAAQNDALVSITGPQLIGREHDFRLSEWFDE